MISFEAPQHLVTNDVIMGNSDGEEAKTKEPEVSMSLEVSLRRQMRGQRGWVTRVLNELDALFLETPANKARIGLELDSLTSKEAKLLETHEALCAELDDDSFEEEMTNLEPILEKIKTAKLQALEIISPPAGNNASSKKEEDKSSNGSEKAASKPKVKLPQLEIEVFKGDPLKWMSFYESFSIIVDENEDLDDRGRLVYLKKYLGDEPKRLVDGIISSDGLGGNYKKAMLLLKERYGRSDVLKETLVERMKYLSEARADDLKSARNLVDEVHLIVGQLESLNVNVNTELGLALIPSVREKMPSSWQQEWARKCERTQDPLERDFNSLMTFLRTELRVSEELARSKTCKKEHRPSQERKKETPLVSTASALKAEVHTRKKVFQCTFCSGSHRPRECDVSMSPSSRMSKVKAVQGCQTCAMKGHSSDRCYWKAKCRKCRGRHIDQLCVSSGEGSQNSAVPTEKAKFATTVCLMRTATVVVNEKVMTRLLADTGGSKTFIRSDVAQQAKAEFIRRDRMEIDHFGGKMLDDFDVVEVEIGGVMTKETITVEAVCVPDLGKISAAISQEEVVKKFGDHFLPLADYRTGTEEELGILLGENFYDEVILGPTNRIADGFKATNTKFGWMIHGGDVKQTRSYAVKVLRAHCAELEKFWELEHLGITDQEVSEGKEDVLREVDYKDNRFWVSWPWREELRPDENRDIADARLKRLEAKMTANEKQEYTRKLTELLNEGYIEEIPDKPEGHVSYLPHRAVMKETSETTKIRIVYDCGAKKRGGLSLNDCLKPGPSLLPKIIGLLLRFRWGKVGTVADLVKAFLQIKLHTGERDVTRFIWNGKEYRSTCVLFGATSSPSILNCVIEHHLENLIEEGKFQNWVLKKLKDDTYVDDCITSLHEETKLANFWKESSEIFQLGSMVLQKIRSSVEGVGEKNLVGKKVVGLPWNEEKDVLSVEVPEIGSVLRTKRAVASFLGKVYDPLGILSPFLTPLKIALQEIWKQGLTWDEPFSKTLQDQVLHAVQYFMCSKGIEFPRWIGANQDLSAVSLHVFMDSSQRIYAGTIYVRVEKETGAVCSLLVAKAKLIPPKMAVGKFSPKFELLACVLGSRLLQTVIQELHWEGVETFFWTDSKVCLYWIKAAPQKWEVYVRNRVYQIQSVPGNWGFVCTEDNPADIPTRENGVDREKWFEGPKWLSQCKTSWPREEIDVWSDHGTNFVALSKSIQGSTWHFIVERAPWWGGLWERLVQSAKNLLKREIGKSLLDFERLETIMVAVENVMNSRPISYYWEGDEQAEIPLCPMDFLLFGKINIKDGNLNLESFANEWKKREFQKNELRDRWESDYLLSVLGHFGKIWNGGVNRVPVVGEVVLVLLEGRQRQTWPLARVQKLHFGGDRIVRAVTVCFGNSTLVRPIRKIFPLELDPKNIPVVVDNEEDCAVDQCLHPTGDQVGWVQCDACDKWLHLICIGKDYIDPNEPFNCSECQ